MGMLIDDGQIGCRECYGFPSEGEPCATCGGSGEVVMSHTPKPWAAGCASDGSFRVAAANGVGEGICHRGQWPDRADESAANARLIAAAPDMLAALKALRIDANRLCDRQLGGTYEDDCRRAIAVADAAIAKATGR